MSAKADDESNPPPAQDGAGVLSQLPRTRPQRASARRAAAREGRAAQPATSASEVPETSQPERSSRPKSTSMRATPAERPSRAGQGAARKGAATRSSAPKVSRQNRASAARGGAATGGEKRSTRAGGQAHVEAVPSQGFATEGERVSGPVPPPRGAELFATAAEIVSELARATVGTGERVIRDVLSRLPLN